MKILSAIKWMDKKDNLTIQKNKILNNIIYFILGESYIFFH